jgi:hypothetical protein
VRSVYSLVLGTFLALVASIPAFADTDLTGKWVGPFHGVQVEIPLQRSPFGWLSGEGRKVEGSRFVDSTLQLEIDTQKQGLATGIWTAGEFKQRFVCAQLSQTVWNCVDAGGRASVEVTSPTEMKVCYLDNREGAQGAGCAQLRKA